MKARHLLAVIAALALLMTAVFSVMGTASVAVAEDDTYNFLKQEYIAEGEENVTINEDGTWTATGNFALAPNVTIDYTTFKYIFQFFTTTGPVKITLLDRDPNENGYGDHWIGLYDNFVGDQYYPVGTYERIDSIEGIYNWNIQYSGWKNKGNATIRAIYFEFENLPSTITLTNFRISGKPYVETTTTAPTQPRYTWDSSKNLTPFDASAWKNIGAGDSDITVNVSNNVLVFGNTNGQWPCAYVDYTDPLVVSPADTAIEYDVAAIGESNIYLFFGEATPLHYQNGCYLSLNKAIAGTTADFTGSYSGTLYFEDLTFPEGALDQNGNVVITGIKVFAISGEASSDVVRINKMNMLYNKDSSQSSATTAATTTTVATLPTTTNTTDTTTTTATQPVVVGPDDFLKEEYIAENPENVQVNADGSWTVSGNFALAPNFAFDYTKTVNIIQKFTSDVPVKITLLDRDPNGIYEDHWIGLYDNFVGPEYYPAGTYDRADNLSGIWTWNVKNSNWGNTGTATVRAIYFEFQGTPNATIQTLKLAVPAPTTTTTVATTTTTIATTTQPTQPRYEWDYTFALAPLDANAWSGEAVQGSGIIVSVSDGALVFGNTAGNWPDGYVTYDRPFFVNAKDTAIAYDVEAKGEMAIVLFFGDATPTSYDNGCYIRLNAAIAGSDADFTGAHEGTIYFEDLNLPAGAVDEFGNVKITGIKVFAIGAAANNIAQINRLDLLYNGAVTTTTEAPTTTATMATTTTTVVTTTTEPATTTTSNPVFDNGDLDCSGNINMEDAFTLYRAVSGQTELTPDQEVLADMDGNGVINIADAYRLYRMASGLA
ncbi:MAG: dockerin type I repeat-containing protein [Clostridia bacterium]|nr:dockerin type I repeat-containing protein [Clostridia bacterium]